MPMMNGYGYGVFWPMLIITAMWLGVIVLGIILAANYFNGKRKKTLEQILQERLAKGKIDGNEYERLMAVLKREGGSEKDEQTHRND